MAWQDLAFAVRVPYGLGPFLEQEVGDGHDDPALFAPSELRPAQWVRAAQVAGAHLLVFTAKQRDGFCLWPSRLTEYSVRAAPWQQGQGDLVHDLALACRAAGMRFGLEYALCDHHEPAAANPVAYNQFLQRQLRELLTEFGPLTVLWLDKACPRHGNALTRHIDWPALLATARDLQPECLLIGDGPDARSVSGEVVVRQKDESSVRPFDPAAPWADCFAAGAPRWRPWVRRVGLRPSLYHRQREENRQRSLPRLLDLYRTSVGRNGSLLLSVPVNAAGVVPDPDTRRLRELGTALRGWLSEPFAETAGAGPTLTLQLKTNRPVGTLLVEEDIRDGERVRRFLLEAATGNGWQVLAEGRGLGHRRLVTFDPRPAATVRCRLLDFDGDDPVRLRRFAAFGPAPTQ